MVQPQEGWNGETGVVRTESRASPWLLRMLTMRPGTHRSDSTRRAARDCAIGLPVEPVHGLDEERVRGVRLEQLVEIVGHRARARAGIGVLPSLRPHQVER